MKQACNDDEFIRQLTEFYRNLAQQQEPLGEEFQKVLDEHFWELLVRT